MRNGLVTLVLVVGTAALLYLFLFNGEKAEVIPYSGPPAEDSFLKRVADHPPEVPVPRTVPWLRDD
jgi:hypothetical protein